MGITNPLKPESNVAAASRPIALHPAWVRFIRYCSEIGHGEIERVKIQDGLPTVAEQAIRKIRFGQ